MGLFLAFFNKDRENFIRKDPSMDFLESPNIKNLHYFYTPSSSIKFKLEVNLGRAYIKSCIYKGHL